MYKKLSVISNIFNSYRKQNGNNIGFHLNVYFIIYYVIVKTNNNSKKNKN